MSTSTIIPVATPIVTVWCQQLLSPQLSVVHFLPGGVIRLSLAGAVSSNTAPVRKFILPIKLQPFYGLHLNRIRLLEHSTKAHVRNYMPSEKYVYRHVDHIYVLNLNRRLDRFQTTRARCLNAEGIVSFERFFGEDCQQTKYNILFSHYQHIKSRAHRQLKTRLNILSAGSLCILYSMKAMLLDAIQNRYSSILVLQDDLFVIQNFQEKFNTQCARYQLIGKSCTSGPMIR